MASKSAIRPEIEELVAFAVSSGVVAAAFTAFTADFSPGNIAFYAGAAALALLVREAGQRVTATFMNANTRLELSGRGSLSSLAIAAFSSLAQIPLLFPVPVESEFSQVKYEEWGKSTDAMWMKRKAWLAGSGIAALLGSYAVLLALDLSKLADTLAVFTAFQMAPLDPEGNVSDIIVMPTGTLDGAYILRLSPWYWMILAGLSLVALATT